MKFETPKHREPVVDLSQYFEELKAHINSLFPVSHSETRKDLCELVAESEKRFLDNRGIDSVIVEGEIQLADLD